MALHSFLLLQLIIYAGLKQNNHMTLRKAKLRYMHAFAISEKSFDFALGEFNGSKQKGISDRLSDGAS